MYKWYIYLNFLSFSAISWYILCVMFSLMKSMKMDEIARSPYDVMT